ncbi:hypothetical protein [Mesorhizobium sp. M1378]|uniref:hypothetical protein n=1 Tax=Mesorhizobium sp. M1378 TaxID=2957092 RepID=UPI0033394150
MAEIIGLIDRSQQLSDHLPDKGTRRQFSMIGSWRIDTSKPSRSLAAIAAKPQKSARFMLKRLAQNLTAQGMDELFHVL